MDKEVLKRIFTPLFFRHIRLNIWPMINEHDPKLKKYFMRRIISLNFYRRLSLKIVVEVF